MGTELSRASTLNSIASRWVDLACGMLEPAEREIVCGDLSEAGEHGWRALREVAGLVIRRRALNFEIARSSAASGALTILTTLPLVLAAMRVADGSSIYLWMWINNSDWAILQSAGYWNPVFEIAPGLLFGCATIVCCSWTCGLLIGWTSKKTRWISALLLIATIVLIAVCGLPDAVGRILILQRARDYQGNAAVFLGGFYRQVFPRAVELILVMLPALWGMDRGPTVDRFKSPARFLLLLLCIGVIGSLFGQNVAWPRLHILWIWPPGYLHVPNVAPVCISVPTAYLLLMIRHRLGFRRAGTA